METRFGPSFQRLYADTVNRTLPERGDWHSGLVDRLPAPPAWADVVVDLRVLDQRHSDYFGERCRESGGECDNGRDDPLPSRLGEPAQVWASNMAGWSLEGFVIDEVHRRTQVLRFTDPEGFRGAIVASGKEAKRSDEPEFEAGRFTVLFPTAANRLLRAVQRHHVDGRLAPPDEWLPLCDADPDAHPSVDGVSCLGEVAAIQPDRYRLEVLRNAMRNPAGWFGLGREADWQALTCPPAVGGDPERTLAQQWLPDAMGRDCPASPDRVLLAYAMAGVSSYEAVEQFVSAGLDPAELGRWRLVGRGEYGGKDVHEAPAMAPPLDPAPSAVLSDEDIVAWFLAVGGGSKARANASNFAHCGLTPTQAAGWLTLGRTANTYASRITVFEAAGWTPNDVLRVQASLSGHSPALPLHLVAARTRTYADCAEWTFTTSEAAVNFIDCGYTVETAHALLATTADPVTVEASIKTIAALRRTTAADVAGF